MYVLLFIKFLGFNNVRFIIQVNITCFIETGLKLVTGFEG